jgi:hypothetical protein
MLVNSLELSGQALDDGDQALAHAFVEAGLREQVDPGRDGDAPLLAPTWGTARQRRRGRPLAGDAPE